MVEPLVKELLSRDAQMDYRQVNWRNAWQDLQLFLAPNAKDITLKRSGGTVKNREVFSSEPIEAASRLAGAITGIITSPSQQWFNFTFGEGLVDLGTEAKDWLQKAAQRTFLAMSRSNFAVEMLQAHLHLVVFGTTSIYLREHPLKPGSLLYETLPIGSYRIQDGIDRKVDTIHRDVEMSLKQLAQHAEEDGWELHPNRWKQLEKEPFKEITVLHCIYPKGQVKHELDTDTYTSVYIDREKKFRMATEGFKEFPTPVSRWMVSGRDEEYGRSPGFKALPGIMTLNTADELGLRAWAKEIDPPVLALHQSVLGTPDLRPSQLTYILEKGALEPFPHRSNINAEVVRTERVLSNIRSIFLMDLLQFLPGEGKTPPSATQINAQQDILLQIAGPELTRQEYELYDPLVSRALLLQIRAKEIEPIPAQIIELSKEFNIPIDIKFEGPVAKAKRRSRAQSIDTMLGWAGQMAEIFPNILNKFNPERAADIRTELEGAPLEILNTEEEIKAIEEAQRQQQEQQQKQQQAEMLTKGVKDLGGIQQLQQLEQSVQQ